MSTSIPSATPYPELTDAVCAYNRSVATNFMYILPQIICSLSGIASVVLLTYSFFLYGFKLLFHYNAKVLMILLTLFCLFFSIDIVFVCVRQVFHALTYSNDCDLVLLTSECSFLRRIALTCFVGVTTTQFSQMLERLVATCLKEKYEFQTQWLGGLFVLFSVLSAILTVEWILWNENPMEPITHCLTYSASLSIGGRMYSVFYGILAVDIFILVIFIGLWSNNKRKVLSSGLNKKYQQHENLVVLRALFPMVSLNTIFVSTYILIAMIVRGFKDTMTLTNYKLFAINTFIFPYVSLLLSIAILVTTRSEFKRRLLRSQENTQNANTQTRGRVLERNPPHIVSQEIIDSCQTIFIVSRARCTVSIAVTAGKHEEPVSACFKFWAEMLRAPAADSNKNVILEVLRRFATPGKKVFEIASGTGQHVAHFAQALPDVTFQPTEVEARSLHSIVAHLDHFQLPNVRIPLFIDVAKRFDQWALPGDFGPHMVDVIVNINMIHICSMAAIEGLFESANQLLNETSGILLTYGPYSEDGFITPQSNIAFNAHLRAQNPEHGIKDIKFLERLANRSNLRLLEKIAVPQNNFILVFSRA